MPVEEARRQLMEYRVHGQVDLLYAARTRLAIRKLKIAQKTL